MSHSRTSVRPRNSLVKKKKKKKEKKINNNIDIN